MASQFDRAIELVKGRPGFVHKRNTISYYTMGMPLFRVEKAFDGAIRINKIWRISLKNDLSPMGLINDFISRPHCTSAWMSWSDNNSTYRIAPGICRVNDGEIKVSWDGEQVKICGVQIPYSYDAAKKIAEDAFVRNGMLREITLNTLAHTIKDIPEFFISPNDIQFLYAGNIGGRSLAVVVIGPAGKLYINNLFTDAGVGEECDIQTAIEYLRRLMCLGQLTQCEKMRVFTDDETEYCAYPHILICDGKKMTPEGERYKLGGIEYVYSFDQFKELAARNAWTIKQQ
jgi:hypothetical protein